MPCGAGSYDNNRPGLHPRSICVGRFYRWHSFCESSQTEVHRQKPKSSVRRTINGRKKGRCLTLPMSSSPWYHLLLQRKPRSRTYVHGLRPVVIREARGGGWEWGTWQRATHFVSPIRWTTTRTLPSEGKPLPSLEIETMEGQIRWASNETWTRQEKGTVVTIITGTGFTNLQYDTRYVAKSYSEDGCGD